MTTTEEQVGVLLELAGITPTPDEVDQLVKEFPQVRERLERIWAIDVGAEVGPSLVFRAAEAAGPQEVSRG